MKRTGKQWTDTLVPLPDFSAKAASTTQQRLSPPRATCGWSTCKAAASACPPAPVRVASAPRRADSQRPVCRCFDGSSCATRAQNTPRLTSSQVTSAATNVTSNRWPSEIQVSGMFSVHTKRNPWAGAHLVMAAYCTSDDWAGATAGVLKTTLNAAGVPGWQFQGQAMIKGLFGILTASPFGLGSVNNTRLLFAGCDAGGRGVLSNLDEVRYMVPDTVEVRGFADGALWPDLVPLYASTLPLTMVMENLYGLVKASARVGPTCGAVYSNASTEWQCLFPQFRLPLIATPLLVANSQFDTVTLSYDTDGTKPPFSNVILGGAGEPAVNVANTSAALYVAAFQMAMRDTLHLLPSKVQPASAAFGSACAGHCTSLRPSFWGVRVGHMSLKTFLSDWYFGGPGPDAALTSARSPSFPVGVPPLVLETCFSYNCGLCHPKGTAAERWAAENAAVGDVGDSASEGDTIRGSDSIVSDAAASSEATAAAKAAARASHHAGSATLGGMAVASMAGCVIIACGSGACRVRRPVGGAVGRAPPPAGVVVPGVGADEALPLLTPGAGRRQQASGKPYAPAGGRAGVRVITPGQ